MIDLPRARAARRLRALVSACLLPAALLAGCGAVASRKPVDHVPLSLDDFAVDGVAYGSGGGEPGTVAVLARLEERSGETLICGAYLKKGDFQLLDFDILAEILTRTQIRFDDQLLVSDLDGFAGPLPWSAVAGREANCMPLSVAWRPEFADKDRLRFDFPRRIVRKG